MEIAAGVGVVATILGKGSPLKTALYGVGLFLGGLWLFGPERAGDGVPHRVGAPMRAMLPPASVVPYGLYGETFETLEAPAPIGPGFPEEFADVIVPFYGEGAW